MRRAILPLSVLIFCSSAAGTTVLDALGVLDDPGSTSKAQHEAALRLLGEAELQPFICIEIARRLHSAIPFSIGGMNPFEDPRHACRRSLIPVIKALRSTDGDDTVLFRFLTREDLLENPAFVTDVMEGFDDDRVLDLAYRILHLELTELAVPISRNITGRFRNPGQEVRVGHNTYYPWECVYGMILTELRTEANRETVDKALRRVLKSMDDPRFQEQARELLPEWEILEFRTRIEACVGESDR